MGGDMEKAIEMLMTMLGNKAETEEEELNEISDAEEAEEDESNETGLENMLGAISGGNDKRVTLLSSIKPYMSGKRQGKIDTAINMVRLMSISSGLGINLFDR